MYGLKPISHDSVAGALAKAERYRLLNEPSEAESICRDILEIEPANQQAVIQLILALTDEIAHNAKIFPEALAACDRLDAAYDRAYYSGLAWERRAKARYHQGGPGARHYTYDWLMEAMKLFEQAERLRASGNDDAVLRWNACVRFLDRHKELAPSTEDVAEPIVSE